MIRGADYWEATSPGPSVLPKAADITATPWEMPAHVPPRPWLYGNHLCRKMVTGTVSPGGVGKSSLAVVDALSLVTGRKLLHHWCHKGDGVRVWFWCGEDPLGSGPIDFVVAA